MRWGGRSRGWEGRFRLQVQLLTLQVQIQGGEEGYAGLCLLAKISETERRWGLETTVSWPPLYNFVVLPQLRVERAGLVSRV